MTVRFTRTLLLAGVAALVLAGCQTTLPLEPTSTPFYAVTRSDVDNPSFLYYMDEFGVATNVGTTDVRIQYIKFNPVDGLLYGTSNPTQGSCAASDLVTLDLVTGAVASTVALSTDGNRAAFTFLPDGTLIAHNNCNNSFEEVDVATGDVTVLGPSGISWYSYGMWTDDSDTVWFVNGDGNVYTVDTTDGSATLVHEGDDWTGDNIDVVRRWGDLHIRGDLNPDTGELWGVSPAYGYVVASAIVRAVVDADGAALIDVAPVQSATAIHTLAFPR